MLAALFTLLELVVAWLAQALEIVLIPEQALITTVRRLVVSHQSRRVAVDATASNHLASEPVAYQHRHAQLLPSRRLVPSTIFETGITMTVALNLTSRRPKPRRKCADTWLDGCKSAHISNTQKGDRLRSPHQVRDNLIAVALALNRCLLGDSQGWGLPAYPPGNFRFTRFWSMPSAQRLAIRIIGSSVSEVVLTLSRSAQHLIRQALVDRRYSPQPLLWPYRHR